MGPRLHLWICAYKTACLAQVSIGPRPHVWNCVHKTACLAPEKQSLCVPNLIRDFVQTKQRA